MEIELKKYKKEYGHSYSFGVFSTLELLQARSEQVVRVLISPRGSRNEGVRKLEEMCRRKQIQTEVNDKLIERISSQENHYVVGIFRKYTQELDATSNHIVLVNPSDMGNLGTIIRTMLGFGVTDLALIKPAADIFDPRAVRSSMGAMFRLRFRYFDTFEEYQEQLRIRVPPGRYELQRNFYPFMTGGSVALDNIRFEQPYSLIFGNESSGLPEEYAGIGTSVTIRHSSAIDSLSLPIAAGIALYTATKNLYNQR